MGDLHDHSKAACLHSAGDGPVGKLKVPFSSSDDCSVDDLQMHFSDLPLPVGNGKVNSMAVTAWKDPVCRGLLPLDPSREAHGTLE